MCDNVTIFLIILLIILFILVYCKYNYKKITENFSFAPYEGNPFYKFANQKLEDAQNLQELLYEWEKPFNEYNEGYFNAESCNGPPLVPIYD